MWSKKRVTRVHHDWGPEAYKMTGEERAELILQCYEYGLVKKYKVRAGFNTPSMRIDLHGRWAVLAFTFS